MARLIDLIPLPGKLGDGEPLLCSIFESPGRNYLKEIEFGTTLLESGEASPYLPNDGSNTSNQQVSVSLFLDFAIGACECLELLHHGLRIVHGELRADAFHYNHETRAVKLINFGTGPRSFENGFTSSGWLTLSRELGIKHKLQYIAPEQTGRMPAEPDSRTDIYSLGIVFWTLLSGRVAFEGKNPIDVVQALLARRLAPVSSIRFDVPDVISNIIGRMTQKQIEDRYHSTTGLKFDLTQIKQMLGDGDSEALANFNIGSKDVSSFFMLPSKQFGVEEAHSTLIKVIEKVASRQRTAQDGSTSSLHTTGSTSSSAASDHRDSLDVVTRSSDKSSLSRKSPTISPRRLRSGHQTSPTGDHIPQLSLGSQDNRALLATELSAGSQRSGKRSDQFSRPLSNSVQTPRQRHSRSSRHRSRCEVVSIVGAAGVGKSNLMTNSQTEVRDYGYFATAKFDSAKKAPFEPLLQAMSSLFRQIFSESDLRSEYHRFVSYSIRPLWPSVCVILDLPESLLDTDRPSATTFSLPSYKGFNRSLYSESADASSNYSARSGSAISYDGLHGPATNPRSVKFITIFIEVLRILSSHKLICLCLDNVQFADDESLELLSNIIERKLGIVMIVSLPECALQFDSDIHRQRVAM